VTDPYHSVVTWIDRPVEPGPLNGLRVGVKDVIAVAGVPRLCGAPALVDPTPQQRDAEVVRRLAAAGAHLVATTSCHQLSFGVTTPGTLNPRAPGRTAGGSSGGAGAALAAGIVDGAVGTDTAGSVRIPAACCGVVGLKTTEGLVSRDGVDPLAPSFDTVGPMARDVATTARLLDAMTDAPVVPEVPRPLRVGVIEQAQRSRVHPDARAVWDEVVGLLAGAGARIERVAIPMLDEAHPALGRIIAAEGYAGHGWAYHERPDALVPDVRQRLAAGERLSHEKLLAARRTAALLRDRLTGVFAQVDVLVLPVLPCRIPLADADEVDVGGEMESVASALTRLVGPANLAGVPAGAVPCGLDADGAPVGMQVMGPWSGEAAVLGVMALIEELVGGPWPAVEATRT
jgi:aspartyl-tRNA(Asn)/glutamyl-tRNA(Gln) amidotransferase subunit A